MPSIRKTKKRLKREIADDRLDMSDLERVKFPTLRQCLLYDALRHDIELLEQDLQTLNRKK